MNIDIPCGCDTRSEVLGTVGNSKLVMVGIVAVIVGIGFMFVRSI